MRYGEVGRVLAVYNPASSQPARADRVIDRLQKSPDWGNKLEVVETQPPDVASNIDVIGRAIQPGDVLLSFGGDGSDNDTFNAIAVAIKSGRITKDEASIMPVPTGNGNDFSKSLYGRNILWGKRIEKLLGSGNTALLDGVHIEATRDGVTYFDRLAHSYFALGYTAKAAKAMNDPNFRRFKAQHGNWLLGKLSDGLQVGKVFLGLEAFEYENGDGQARLAKELTFANMRRMASGTLIYDTTAFNRKLLTVEFSEKAFMLQTFKAVCAGKLTGGIKGESIEEQHIKLLTDAPIQYDGEPADLPADTEISIRHQKEIVSAIV